MLKIRDIMTRDVLTATPDMTLQGALEVLSESHIGGLPVVEGGTVVGILSATDLIAYLAEMSEGAEPLTFKEDRNRPAALEDVTVADVMTRMVHSLPPEASVQEAASVMAEKQIHRIVVQDESGLAGVLTASDIAKAVASGRMKTRTFVFS